MDLVEQYPLSVILVATFAFRFPEQVIIGIESNKLISGLHPAGIKVEKEWTATALKASLSRFSLLLKAL